MKKTCNIIQCSVATNFRWTMQRLYRTIFTFYVLTIDVYFQHKLAYAAVNYTQHNEYVSHNRWCVQGMHTKPSKQFEVVLFFFVGAVFLGAFPRHRKLHRLSNCGSASEKRKQLCAQRPSSNQFVHTYMPTSFQKYERKFFFFLSPTMMSSVCPMFPY